MERDPTPPLGSTVELSLMALWVTQPGGHEHGRVDPISHLHEVVWDSYFSLPCPLGWKTPHRVKSSGELFLTLTSCSSQESRPCTVLRQHIRADPGGGGTHESALRTRVLESWPCHSSALRFNASVGRACPGVIRAGELVLPLTRGNM